MTTLHAGGKFNEQVYHTAGGLHGVGISVVNALSEELTVEVARDQQLYVQEYSRGFAQGKLRKAGSVKNRRGTSVTFVPDQKIFGNKAKFPPGEGLPPRPLEGLPVPRRRDPLEMRPLAAAAGCAGAGTGDHPLPQRAAGFPHRRARRTGHRHPALRRRGRACRRQGPRRMGHRLAEGRCRRPPLALLQHHPDARGRHARAGPARRVVQIAAQLRRDDEEQARRDRHRRRRDAGRRRHPLAVRQGPAVSRGRPKTSWSRPTPCASSRTPSATRSTISSPATSSAATRC